MLKAARFGDEISHTQQRSGLIAGMIIGALIVGAVVLAVASGGTAIPALIAVGAVLTGAAVGGGIGQLIGGEMTVPKGAINKAATTVFVNSRATPARVRALTRHSVKIIHSKRLCPARQPFTLKDFPLRG